MEETLWEWLTDQSADGANVPNHLRIRQGKASHLFGLWLLTMLLVPPLFVARWLGRLRSKNTYRW